MSSFVLVLLVLLASRAGVSMAGFGLVVGVFIMLRAEKKIKNNEPQL